MAKSVEINGTSQRHFFNEKKTIFLKRTDDTAYVTYKCNYCSTPVGRYNGEQFLELPDLVEMPASFTVKCIGCDFIYEFTWLA